MDHRLKMFLISFGVVLLVLFTLVGFSSKQNKRSIPPTNVPTGNSEQSVSLTPTNSPITSFPTITNVPTQRPTSGKQLENGYCSNEKRGGQWICPSGYFCDNIPVKFECPNGEPCAVQYQGTCRLIRPD